MHDDDLNDDFRRNVREVASRLRAARSTPDVDRAKSIICYEQLSHLVQGAVQDLVVRLPSESPFTGLGEIESCMFLYEEMNLYNLLSDGWGADLYTKNNDPDVLDERLFLSLITIVMSTSIAMEGYDLNKRALEALVLHVLTLDGRTFVSRWVGVFSTILEICT